jgi:hypothetical protein
LPVLPAREFAQEPLTRFKPISRLRALSATVEPFVSRLMQARKA